MKILAIRGKDLASLAGRFELDLARPPLSEAGLFAITGATGSGKSTLLDAMCLALFDRTPRLGGRGRQVGFLQEIDRETLNSGDPRCLLRRGSAEGYAEVDFLGSRGERWRSRWSVRRARNDPEGRLQSQTVRLENLDTGVQAGGTKRQTLAAIEQALGLDYAGFCRSVLLAQGDFASFLRARPEERAELLERMTGTDLYGRLSIAAHQRATKERHEEERLADRLAGAPTLEPSARRELEAALLDLEARAKACNARLEAAQAFERWVLELERRREQREAARRALEAAEADWRASADEREELKAADRVRPLTPLVEARERAREEAQSAEREQAQAEARAASAATSVEALGRERDAADARLEAALAARSELAPQLERAALLDEARRERVALCERARADQARGAELVASLAEELQALAGERARVVRQAEAARAELAEDPAGAALAEQWPRWSAGLARAERLLTEQPGSAARAREAVAHAREAHAERERVEARAQEAQRRLAGLETSWEAGRAEAARWPERRAAWDDRRLRLTELTSARERSLDARAREASAREEALSARADEAEALAAAAEAETGGARAEVALEEAEGALRRAEQALDLAGLRHDLVEGEPCALCGSEEHPYAEALPALDALLSDQRERVETLRRGRAEAQAVARAERRAGDDARAVAEAAEARAGEAEREALAAEQRWAELAWKASWSLGQDAASLGPDAEAGVGAVDARRAAESTALARKVQDAIQESLASAGEGERVRPTRSTALDQALAEAEAELAALNRQEAERREAAEQLAQARAATAAAREALLQSERGAELAEAAAERAKEIAADLDAQLSALLDELDGAFAEAPREAADEARPETAVQPEGREQGAESVRNGGAEARRAHAESASSRVEAAWRVRFRQAPAEFFAECTARVERRVACQETLRAASARLAELEPGYAALSSRVDGARERLADLVVASAAGAQALEAVETERAGLLGGRTLDVVRAELTQREAQARAEAKACEAALRSAETARAAASAQLEEASRRAAREGAALEARRAELSAALVELAGEGAADSALIELRAIADRVQARGTAWASEARERAEVARERLESARVGLALRERAVEDHTHARPAEPQAPTRSSIGVEAPTGSYIDVEVEAKVDLAAEPDEDAGPATALESATRAGQAEAPSAQAASAASGAAAAPPASETAAALARAAASVRRAQAERETTERERGAVGGRLAADRESREQARQLRRELEEQRERANLWQRLGSLIGSHDGKRLRVFAQSLTLELLLEHANATLERLAPRYRLARVEGQDLDLQVIDRTLGDEVRATSSLSGGESFLASLALALGLSALSGDDTQVESLFVDEGFGSLDPDAQELALATLDALQAEGRQVALISHVPGLAERVGVGVQVVSEGQGASRVVVSGALHLVSR